MRKSPSTTGSNSTEPGTPTTPAPETPTTGKKKGVDKTIPLRKKAPKNDDEILDDSKPIAEDTITKLVGGVSDIFSGTSIGGFSLSTILLIILAVTVGFLLIKGRGK
jgi:hypothetical protein